MRLSKDGGVQQSQCMLAEPVAALRISQAQLIVGLNWHRFTHVGAGRAMDAATRVTAFVASLSFAAVATNPA